jgi:Zn-dependent peptidase ImmA (M78 family)
MSYEPVSATNLPKSAITDLAEKVALEFGYDPAAPLEDIVTAFGGTIEYKNMREVEKTNDGSIQIEEDGSFRIFLPDYVSVERNRFTIAHELGHYVLHREAGKKQKAARLVNKENKREEWEANWFAAGFLMPKAMFLEKFEEFEGRPVALARYFRVSVQSAEIQAKNYGKMP